MCSFLIVCGKRKEEPYMTNVDNYQFSLIPKSEIKQNDT